MWSLLLSYWILGIIFNFLKKLMEGKGGKVCNHQKTKCMKDKILNIEVPPSSFTKSCTSAR